MDEARSPVQGVEFWVPKDDVLILRAGAYGPHTEFARVSARSSFRFGEGLPGAVWATERALSWQNLGTHFVRAERAAEAGIDAAVGIPWFVGNDFVGVLTLLLTKTTPTPACVEIWNHDETIDVLRHGGGHYASTPELERVSPLLQFPYAAGLPGMTWSTGMAVVLDDVRHSNEFVRAELAARAGLKRAVGVPIFRKRRVAHVLALLGAEVESFIRSFELFVPGEIALVSKLRAEDPARAAIGEPPPNVKELAEVARISRLPNITAAPLRRPGATGARSEIFLSLPMHDGARLRGVACLEF